MSGLVARARGPLRPLQRGDVPALADLVRANRGFLAATSPLRTEQYFTDDGRRRTATGGGTRPRRP